MGEREHQLEVLRSAVERARTGHGSVLLLTGETGLGKTTLLKALAAEVRDVVRVLAGGCDDLGEPRRLGALRDAGVEVGGDYPSLLGRLGAEPTVLMIDDVQWADDATLDLLGYLARRVHDQPLAVVLALRDDAWLPQQVRRWLGSLATAGLQRLALAPLSLEAVRGLAGDEAERVYALAGGNPFYTAELLASAGVPATVSDAVLAKVARLSDAGRLAVEQLAVVPGTVDLELVERLVREQGALVEAEQCGLLEARSEGLGFRHEIVRLAIEEGMPGLRRRMLHKAALDAQAKDEDRYLVRLAHHAIAASDSEGIAVYVPRAGQQAAAAGVRDEALRMFEAAWQRGVLPAELVGAYAWELFNAYRFTEAIDLGLPEKYHHFVGVEARWDGHGDGSVPERDLAEIRACLEQLHDGRWAAVEERLAGVLRRVGGPNLLQAGAAAVLYR
jgi:predicted ATPase